MLDGSLILEEHSTKWIKNTGNYPKQREAQHVS